MWSLENPAALFLLLLLPFFIYAVHFRKKRGAKLGFSFRVWKGEGFNPAFRIIRLVRTFSYVAFWIGFCSIIIALAGPIRIEKEKVFLSQGIHIMIVLDESPSMLAQDFSPGHRFDTAKKVIRDFVRGRENDGIGLVSFSETAILRVPVTLNYDYLLSKLDSLEIEGLSDGTAIGMGLSLAGLHLKASAAAGKIIILITDGENNAGQVAPEIAADMVNELGIKIHTIGIGQEGEAYMEIKDPQTGKIIKGMYRGKFDETLLRTIAWQSGGEYFHASSPGTLSAIFQRIDSMEKTEKRVKLKVNRIRCHRMFVFLALFLILTDFLVRRWFIREVF